MTSSANAEPKGSEPSSTEPALMCTCGHSRNWHPKANGGACMGDNCLDCVEFRCDHSRCGWKPREEEPEPPMTPEEEEQAPPDEELPASPCPGWSLQEPHEAHDFVTPTDGPARCPGWEEPPPQPDRRPPYAVAYSVQGHLYEVALPGDASVQAVDGALVIQHALGPVAGICQVLPVISKESA